MLERLFGLMMARLFSPAASFLLIVLVARLWGRSDLGAYNTVLAWLAIFQFVSVFGASEYIAREVGKELSATKKYLAHGLLFGLASSAACAGIMVGGAGLFRYDEVLRQGIVIASLSLPFSVWTIICQAVFTAHQRIRLIAAASASESFLILALGSAAVVKGHSLAFLVWSIVAARALGSALNLWLMHSRVEGLSLRLDRGFFLKLLKPIAVFGLTSVAFQIFMRVDVVMLSKMKDLEAVGLYSSARKLTEIFLMLPLAFYVLNLPLAARGYTQFRDSMEQKIESHTKALFVIVFLVFGFVVFFADSILGLLYGRQFAEASGVLRILMLAYLVQSADMVLGMSCQAAGHHRFAMYAALSRAAMNVALNLVLIPVWGLTGAALATLASVSASAFMFQYFVNRSVHAFRWGRIALRPALVCGLSVFAVYLLARHMNTFLLGSLYFLGYGSLFLVIHMLPIKRVRVT
jgi:O-antigen/teichoic acid export membrane protein